MDNLGMVNGEGFSLLMEELREIRKRLDHHIDDEKHVLDQLRRDVASVKEELTAHKTKLTAIASGIALIVTTFFSWVWDHLR